MDIEALKFPIGKFEKPADITKSDLEKWISDIATFPVRLHKEIQDVTFDQLEATYRPDGWTIKQLVHHCADSHMNAFIRLKLALTEDSPTIKPYIEGRWAMLTDANTMDVLPSLKILEGVHERWSALLQQLTEEQFKRVFIHPEHGKIFSIAESTGMYAWHGNHHLAHIKLANKVKGNERSHIP
jgi:hypothetical protein